MTDVTQEPQATGANLPAPAAEQIGAWALKSTFDDLPEALIDKAKLHFLDQIGAQVRCVGLPTPRTVVEYVRRYGRPGRATVLGTDIVADAESAGLANGTSGSAFEIDDYGYGAFAHPGCVAVPGALAIGEGLGASGREVLTAATLGSELVIRLALAGMPSMLLERGFHETAAHGVFAVALTTAVLSGYDIETTTNALAIAGSHASGTTEYAQSGGEVKRLHAGMGVAGGIRSARLAKLGLTGPATILEGRRGFLQAFSNVYDVAPLIEELGQRWHFLERGAIKPYPTVGLVHQHFAAWDKIVAAHKVQAKDVESVVLGCDPMTLSHAGQIGPRPRDMVSAQFSAEFGMALRIVAGRNDMSIYTNMAQSNFADPAVIAMADRVSMVPDEEVAAEFPRAWPGRVTVTLRDGSVFSDTGHALGSPLNPWSSEGIVRKNRDLLEPVLGSDTADEVIESVMDLENLPDVRQLTGLLTVS